MIDPSLLEQATALLAACRARGLRIATAESCTGGLVAGVLTEIAGSSDVVDRGFVTYSNAAKTVLLGVAADLIGSVGAVSEEVALGMATGALIRSDAQLTVAVTGIAGPGGGSPEKPVGLVWFGLAGRGAPQAHRRVFAGDRAAIRWQSVAFALSLLGSRAAE